jgi:hypothetical protein
MIANQSHPFDLCLEYARKYAQLDNILVRVSGDKSAMQELRKTYADLRHHMWRQYHLSQNTDMSVSKRDLPTVCRDAITEQDDERPEELEEIQSLLTYMDMEYTWNG